MFSPLVSIIMPIYNVCNYIDIAVNSILEQNYDNFELILVDDGSSDGSGEHCDIISERDKRVHTVHQKNSGAGNARNAGLNIAKGKYVYFVDADDYIDRNLLYDNITAAEKYNADIVLFGLYVESPLGDVKTSSHIAEYCKLQGLYSKKDIISKHFYTFFKTRPLTHCVRIYKREFLINNNIKFGSQPMGEDRMFVLSADNADDFNIYITQKRYYHYVQHQSSSIRKYYKEGYAKYGIILAEKFEEIVVNAGVSDKKSIDLCNLQYAEVILYELQNITRINSELKYREKVRIIKELMKNSRIKKAVKEVPVSDITGGYSKITIMLLRFGLYNTVFLFKKLW